MAPSVHAPPASAGLDDDLERARLKRTLRAVFVANLLGIAAYMALAPLDPAFILRRLWICIPLVALVLLAGVLLRRGRLRQSGILIVAGMSVSLAGVALLNGGVRAPAFPGLILMVLMGGLLLGARAALAVAAFSVAVGLGAIWADAAGLLPPAPVTHSGGALLVAYSIYLLLGAYITGLTMASVRAALSRARSELRERRSATSALRTSEQKFASAFRSSPVAMAVVRMADGRVLAVNAAFDAMVGWRSDEAVGQAIDALGIWADEAERQRAAHALAAQGAMRDYEFVFRRRDGSTGVALFSAELIDFGGETAALAAALDLTARKRSEEERLRIEAQMLQAQKLESLGLLAGGIAHDFNNLLAGVLGNASLLLLDTPADAAQRAPLSAIEQAARRAAELCAQLLTYAGRGQPALEPVDLAALVHEMVGIVRVSVGRQASLSLDLPPGLPAVLADASQLRQVVLNLLTNAAEAIAPPPDGPGEGKIRLRLRATHYDAEALRELDPLAGLEPADYVALEIADSGCGMDAETVRQIFDPFFTTKPSGHGLGLSAVQGIVRRHGGAIGVRSQPGRGTIFTVLLPSTSAAPAPPAPAALAEGWRPAGPVLVVDDEPAVRELAARILRRYRVEAIIVADGREAIARMQERGGPIALVLLDLSMPGLDGPATLAELRRIDPGLPALLSSGYSGAGLAGLLEPGRTGFIQKPYQAQELVAKIRELLSGGE